MCVRAFVCCHLTETLQEQAVKAGVLGLLDQCLHQHPDDEDLVNMAMASIISIADSGGSGRFTRDIPNHIAHLISFLPTSD